MIPGPLFNEISTIQTPALFIRLFGIHSHFRYKVASTTTKYHLYRFIKIKITHFYYNAYFLYIVFNLIRFDKISAKSFQARSLCSIRYSPLKDLNFYQKCRIFPISFPILPIRDRIRGTDFNEKESFAPTFSGSSAPMKSPADFFALDFEAKTLFSKNSTSQVIPESKDR